jgi:hypothetical protein
MKYCHLSVEGTPLEKRAANFRSCIQRRLPHVGIGKPLPQSVAIVAGGPSVVHDLETIRGFAERAKRDEAFVVAINGAHDWLQDNGIVPDAMILCDPDPLPAGYCRHPNDTTTYLIASCCDPAVFDALAGKRVVMWHSMQGCMFEGDVADGDPLVVGGPSCATRAPHLLWTMGFRDFHMFGVDSSYGAKTHGVLNFGLSDPTADPIFAEVGGEYFMTDMQMAMQAEYLWHQVSTAPKDTTITIHGTGLGPAVVKAQGVFEILPQ